MYRYFPYWIYSVPGLSAKPKIDMILIAKTRSIIQRLEKIGYQYREEFNIPLKWGFSKKGKYDVFLHVFFNKEHPEVELNLSFRNYLRSHPEIRKEYEELKYKILEDNTSQERAGKFKLPNYTLQKRAFIDKVIAKTGYNRLRVLKCVTDQEWKEVERLQKLDIKESEKLDEKFEYFVLYRGVKIIACSKINLIFKDFKIFGNLEENEKVYFENLIEEWLCVNFLN